MQFGPQFLAELQGNNLPSSVVILCIIGFGYFLVSSKHYYSDGYNFCGHFKFDDDLQLGVFLKLIKGFWITFLFYLKGFD